MFSVRLTNTGRVVGITRERPAEGIYMTHRPRDLEGWKFYLQMVNVYDAEYKAASYKWIALLTKLPSTQRILFMMRRWNLGKITLVLCKEITVYQQICETHHPYFRRHTSAADKAMA